MRHDATNTRKNLAITHFSFEDMRKSIGKQQFSRIAVMVIVVVLLTISLFIL